jgi:transposase
MKELLTSREAAQILGVSTSTLKKWRLEKRGPAYVKGGGKTAHPRYRRTGLNAFINNATVEPVT